MSKTNKNILKTILIIVFSFIILIVCLFSIRIINRKTIQFKNEDVIYESVKNLSNKLVLLIGDGMGKQHVKLNKDLENLITNSQVFGDVKTDSLTLLGPTDSAASATALATGVKVNNKEVSQHNNKNIKTISEYMKDENRGVAIITTDNLSGATPSCFSSHAPTRGDEEIIINGQIKSNIDLYLGKSTDMYVKKRNEFENAGYSFVSEYDDLNLSSNKIIGCFDTVNNTNGNEETPDILMLIRFAIEYMELKYKDTGYFIMLEEAHVDKNSHNNNISGVIDAVNGLTNVTKYLNECLTTLNSFSYVLTSDHETGNLSLKNINSDSSNITNYVFGSKGHTSKNVYYMLKTNNNKEIYLPKTIDNTDIYKICKGILLNGK